MIDYLTEDLFLSAFEKTTPKPQIALLDWKGLSGLQRNKIRQWCESNNIQIEKTSSLK